MHIVKYKDCVNDMIYMLDFIINDNNAMFKLNDSVR